jgi:hypothetical protein
VSKFSVVLLGALVSALVLSSTASAGVSKYCRLLSAGEIGRPMGTSQLRAQGVSIAYPSQTKAKGRITICSFRTRADTIAQTSVAKFTNATGARREFAAIIHREQKAGTAKKTSGPWSDAYYLGQDGFVVLKGRYMFHIQYASGIPGYSNVTPKFLAGLAGRAVRKL